MIDSLIAAWIAAADEDFGGSLDTPMDELYRPKKCRAARSGTPFVYRYSHGWQVKIPGVRSRCFPLEALDEARAFVGLHVELT